MIAFTIRERLLLSLGAQACYAMMLDKPFAETLCNFSNVAKELDSGETNDFIDKIREWMELPT